LEREAEMQARIAAARNLSQAQVKAAHDAAETAIAAAAANGRALGEDEVRTALEAQAVESAAQLEAAQQAIERLMAQAKGRMETAVAKGLVIVTGSSA
jgi:hypothetical protein